MHHCNIINDIFLLQFWNYVILQYCCIPSTCDGARFNTCGSELFKIVRTDSYVCDAAPWLPVLGICVMLYVISWRFSSDHWKQILEFMFPIKEKCASSVHYICYGWLLSSNYLMRKKNCKVQTQLLVYRLRHLDVIEPIGKHPQIVSRVLKTLFRCIQTVCNTFCSAKWICIILNQCSICRICYTLPQLQQEQMFVWIIIITCASSFFMKSRTVFVEHKPHRNL